MAKTYTLTSTAIVTGQRLSSTTWSNYWSDVAYRDFGTNNRVGRDGKTGTQYWFTNIMFDANVLDHLRTLSASEITSVKITIPIIASSGNSFNDYNLYDLCYKMTANSGVDVTQAAGNNWQRSNADSTSPSTAFIMQLSKKNASISGNNYTYTIDRTFKLPKYGYVLGVDTVNVGEYITISGEATLTVVTTEIDGYTITYKRGTNDRSIGEEMVDIKPANKAVNLKYSIFIRTGYIQNGWATSSGGTKVYNLGASYNTNSNITLYPSWEIIEGGNYFKGSVITAADFINLKKRVKAECSRRRYTGSVANYSLSDYDYNVTPTQGNVPLPEHYNKIVTPMNAIVNTGLTTKSSGNVIPALDKESESLTGSSWQLNNSVSIPSNATFNISFSSNGKSYINLVCNTGESGNSIAYGQSNISELVYTNGSWRNQNSRTISITGGSQVNNSTLISWLNANATKLKKGTDPIDSLIEYLEKSETYTITSSITNCKASCTGLCTTACTGTCKNGCTTTCQGTCSGGCGDGCTNSCSTGCATNCKGYCLGSCGNACSLSCTTACTGTCSGGCQNNCKGYCTSQNLMQHSSAPIHS